MAIYGIGAYYDGESDVSGDFISQGVACIGWSAQDAPTLHNVLHCLKVGDIMYIKSQPPGQGLIIKAVGILTDNTVVPVIDLGVGVQVHWFWTGIDRMGPIDDKYNVRSITIYEEFSPQVQTHVLGLLTQRLLNN